jgi:hypothetical protein
MCVCVFVYIYIYILNVHIMHIRICGCRTHVSCNESMLARGLTCLSYFFGI